ncbi:MAG TPA: hypothetical protein VE912_06140 [Bacteroidales bacterium]|nr:hypothetical protein [Bacteroidales bacterium]
MGRPLTGNIVKQLVTIEYSSSKLEVRSSKGHCGKKITSSEQLKKQLDPCLWTVGIRPAPKEGFVGAE